MYCVVERTVSMHTFRRLLLQSFYCGFNDTAHWCASVWSTTICAASSCVQEYMGLIFCPFLSGGL